ncbi:DUF2520 domain-containing protein [Paracrocinitomix mangrovi]|uniref:Rossmann-like and DUF2520 domain-containing protein n=1 Tax=Paracrocinitomix mangrovi TaxID=2862509 RepID=UPI001C8E2215|nr:Rossmann-like and DUF2520 domain-containing protein [Paracrocinitomix mangrovi]UKN02417.1 DUF2520 domain-containing protein [Paracrocinitomix mangrovi]
MIKSINIIGSGNVAHYFGQQLKNKVLIKNVFSRDLKHAKKLAEKIGALPVSNLMDLDQNVDLNIICVSDKGILEVCNSLNKSIAAVHTSGMTDLKAFDGFSHYGVIYPLQTMSKKNLPSKDMVPIFIESNVIDFEHKLLDLSKNTLGEEIKVLSSAKRSKMHLAAVFANNFVNYMLRVSGNIAAENELDFEVLLPLVQQTIKNAAEIGAEDSQTGPAIRKDEETINKHLALLKDEDRKRLYQLISELISKGKA